MSQDVAGSLPQPSSEPIDGCSLVVIGTGSSISLLDGLSEVENRIGVIEGRITSQTLWGDLRREAGRDAKLSDEIVANYERILVSYHAYRALILRQAWPEPWSPRRPL